MHRTHFEENAKNSHEPQRRLNRAMKDVVRTEVLKLLDACIIYQISDSARVSSCCAKEVWNHSSSEPNELVPARVQTWWHVCIDYHKLNVVTIKDHFPLPFIDQML